MILISILAALGCLTTFNAHGMPIKNEQSVDIRQVQFAPQGETPANLLNRPQAIRLDDLIYPTHQETTAQSMGTTQKLLLAGSLNAFFLASLYPTYQAYGEAPFIGFSAFSTILGIASLSFSALAMHEYRHQNRLQRQ